MSNSYLLLIYETGLFAVRKCRAKQMQNNNSTRTSPRRFDGHYRIRSNRLCRVVKRITTVRNRSTVPREYIQRDERYCWKPALRMDDAHDRRRKRVALMIITKRTKWRGGGDVLHVYCERAETRLATGQWRIISPRDECKNVRDVLYW